MTTDKQKKAVHFCEMVFKIEFEGDIDNFSDVSEFLSDYLESAKDLWLEIVHEYEAYIWAMY